MFAPLETCGPRYYHPAPPPRRILAAEIITSRDKNMLQRPMRAQRGRYSAMYRRVCWVVFTRNASSRLTKI